MTLRAWNRALAGTALLVGPIFLAQSSQLSAQIPAAPQTGTAVQEIKENNENQGDGAKPAPAKAPPTHPLQFQMHQACKRGADWLFRMNGPKGKFVPGLLVDVQQEIEQDSLIRQAIGAMALARASKTLGEERLEMRAIQAILALIEETDLDKEEPGTRVTRAPSLILNKLGGGAIIALAIFELPNPTPDLLKVAEELIDGLRRYIKADGLFQGDGWQPAMIDELDGPASYPFMAIAALARSDRFVKESWKMETAKQAYAAYSKKWHEQKQLGCMGWLTRAGVEIYANTKDKAVADYLFGVCDGLTGLQYDRIDPRRAGYYGGFRSWNAAGQVQEMAPAVTSAAAAEAIALGWRLASDLGDPTRHAKYQECLERSLQFFATLQYVETNTKHFADWYQPKLLGGVRFAPQDGKLRIEFTAHALLAWALYLEQPLK